MRMTVSLLIISFSWTMIFSISVWTSSSFNSVPLLQIAQRRQHTEQIAALTEEIEELRSRQAMILHNLDCKNNGEAKRFGSYLDKLEEMQEKLATQREIHTQQLSIGTKQYLEIENAIHAEDAAAVYQQCTAVRPIIAVEREQALLHESRVDDAAIQLAEQLVDAKNKYSYNKANQRSTVRSRTDRAR